MQDLNKALHHSTVFCKTLATALQRPCIQWRTQGGNGGVRIPNFIKVGPRDSQKNVIKLVGVDSFRSVKKWSLRFSKSKQRMVFSRSW